MLMQAFANLNTNNQLSDHTGSAAAACLLEC